jgi:radical SAM protein with 4Fe4S-binding SPASM domain
VLHHSGESFLHKDLFEFIHYAKEAHLTVGLTTNGTLLAREDFRILSTGIDSLNISLGGTGEEDYRRVRTADDFAVVKENILTLASRKRESGVKIRLCVNVVSTKYNKDSLEDFKEEISSVEGIDDVLVRRLLNWSGSVDVRDLSMNDSMDVDKKRRQHSLRRRLRQTLGGLRPRNLCKSVHQSAGILWDGTIVPCCIDFNGTLALGNIVDGPFLDTWNGKKMARLRKMLRSRRLTKNHPICGPCRFGPQT